MSAFWVDTYSRFLATDKQVLVIRAGRRSGKSSGLQRIAVLTTIAGAMNGTWTINPGECPSFVFVSTTVSESSARLRGVKAILTALGLPFTATSDTIEVQVKTSQGVKPVSFRCIAAQGQSLVGITSVGAVIDECCRLPSSEDSPRALQDLIAALLPTMASQKGARLYLSSSPLTNLDHHAERFSAGETEQQSVAYCPTWVGNPSISEEWTRKAEPNPVLWAREYQAIPQDSSLDALSVQDFDSCVVDVSGMVPVGPAFALCDSSGGRFDSWSYAVGQYCWNASHEREHLWFHITTEGLVGSEDIEPTDPSVTHPWAVLRRDNLGNPLPNPAYQNEGSTCLVIRRMGAFTGRFGDTISFDNVCDHIAAISREENARLVFGDGYGRFGLESAFQRRGLKYQSVDWTNASKAKALAKLTAMMRTKEIAFEPGEECDELRKEVLAFQVRISPNGNQVFGARRGHHDDRLACVISALIQETNEDGGLPGSPNRKRGFARWSAQGERIG